MAIGSEGLPAPIEILTVAGVIADLARRGFTEHFMVANSRLRAAGRPVAFAADQLTIAEFCRFEGVSDPDDMSIVYAIESRSGLRGTLTDAFGVYADPSVSDFIEEVPLGRAR